MLVREREMKLSLFMNVMGTPHPPKKTNKKTNNTSISDLKTKKLRLEFDFGIFDLSMKSKVQKTKCCLFFVSHL